MNRQCKVCDRWYEDRGSHSGIRRDVCSVECSDLRRARRVDGKRSAPRTCEQCGTAFLGNRRSRFCSIRCSAENQKTTKLRGETIPCAHCGEPFYRKRSQPTQQFCSHACRGTAMPAPSQYPEARAKIAAAKMGAGNAMFRDGLSADTVRRRHFNLALKGESCCRNCGERGQLHMHHVIPRSMHRAGITEIRNGIPLCPRCHHGWHHRSITIYRDVFTAEEWEYLSGVELLGQDVGAWLDDRYPARVITGNREAAA